MCLKFPKLTWEKLIWLLVALILAMTWMMVWMKTTWSFKSCRILIRRGGTTCFKVNKVVGLKISNIKFLNNSTSLLVQIVFFKCNMDTWEHFNYIFNNSPYNRDELVWIKTIMLNRRSIDGCTIFQPRISNGNDWWALKKLGLNTCTSR